MIRITYRKLFKVLFIPQKESCMCWGQGIKKLSILAKLPMYSGCYPGLIYGLHLFSFILTLLFHLKRTMSKTSTKTFSAKKENWLLVLIVPAMSQSTISFLTQNNSCVKLTGITAYTSITRSLIIYRNQKTISLMMCVCTNTCVKIFLSG